MNDGDLIRLAFGAMSPATVDRLVERYGGFAGAVRAIRHGRTRVSARTRSAVEVDPEQRMVQLRSAGVSFINGSDVRFPDRLRRYPSSPRWLFTRGGRLGSGPAIGIVGTRTCTRYGTDLAYRYGAIAGERGWTVVSGLARGIDASAHRGAVDAGARCHVVLGSGVDVVYPRSNTGLLEDVLEIEGVVSSEFPPGTPPEAWRFPTRNRIIAALSDVVVVVEAGDRGGALITARIALDYGIPVYAVPGDIDREASVGTNRLIRDGAFPVFGPDDFDVVLSLIEPLVAPVAPGGR